MSTQHPDNVNIPFFAEDPELGGEDEIQEAYYAFSHLGCDEQMWDCEGKEVDSFVVKKLLTKYEPFFKEKILGQDIFLTLRVPNPAVEKAEAKVLLETLESIPRSFDAASLFYGCDVAPIFEVILPMTASATCLDRVYRYYTDFVVGKGKMPFYEGDITIAEWIGNFKPERINVIPLFEDMRSMLLAHEITWEFLKNKKIKAQRVFIARSDPAMNYGLISAVLMNKIAFQRLHRLSEEKGLNLYPILGVGSAPFRGNLRPETTVRVAKEYPSVYTFTIQSAFKYDHDPEKARKSIQYLKDRKTGPPQEVEEKRCLEIIEKYVSAYRVQIANLAPTINAVANQVPRRRKRKLHVGLFGYAREVEGIHLPRVITFVAALYTLGLPPEILGINALTKDDLEFLKWVYVNIGEDLKDAMNYYNPESPFIPPEIRKAVEILNIEVTPDVEHREATNRAIKLMKEGPSPDLKEPILLAASRRKFLG
ncbi:MAG TPA: phosphoenolpyruvate carboxylase [Syntrophales bacterium]|nr:phosphoenolpyruvate carboxylase [Syntrophales bacterium]HOL59904.1 phosphoenolpyruvate carboxylase [Syntrophales bacterium]HPO36051.1 phosphoenolpyruvate carboxylase [Syntrophales bacterium]